MLGTNVWRRVLGVDRATVVESVGLDDRENVVVAHVRPRRGSKRRCGRCGVPAPLYDRGEDRRRWRALDLGTVMCFLEADAPRVFTTIALAFSGEAGTEVRFDNVLARVG